MADREPVAPDERDGGPCGNADCDKCDPRPRWRITKHRVQHITYEREIKAATEAEALEVFAQGTAWPTSYDDQYGEIVQQDAPMVVRITGEGGDDQSDVDKRKLAYYREECCYHDVPPRLGAAREIPE